MRRLRSKAGADGRLVPSPLCGFRAGGDRADSPAREENPSEVIARLGAANAELRAQNLKLIRGREILQQAAKYFVGETNR